jgi:hypothetical protein
LLGHRNISQENGWDTTRPETKYDRIQVSDLSPVRNGVANGAASLIGVTERDLRDSSHYAEDNPEIATVGLS